MSSKLSLVFLLLSLVAISGGCASIAKGVAGPVHELRNALVGNDQQKDLEGESAEEDAEVEPMFKVYQRHSSPVSTQPPYYAYGNDANWYRAHGKPVPDLIVEKRAGHASWESNPKSKRKW